MATTTSRPITWRFMCASALSSPVRLWRYCDDGFVRREVFQPFFVVVMEARFVVVDEDGGGDVHGVDQDQSFFHAAFGRHVSTCEVMLRNARRAGDSNQSSFRYDFII